MYLKSIEVQGFKSFANKIKFEFHNGITGIVGPNGSGKSNVADAVRWVLGEQRIKQLRGGKMEDVIFAGTENRKPLGYAYVAITLDNADHQLAIEYEEVTVSRRLFRSGESEYRINGSVCRLKDIHELFYDTGIGKEGYSIIGQGQIDKILSGKPEERRELFDEAAGIVKFKRRKAETIKKLENEKQNLVRVTDILTELEKQVKPLEKQSENAREYLKLREELKADEVESFLLEVGEINKEIASLEEKEQISRDDLAQSNQKLEEIKKTYEVLENSIEEMNRTVDEKKQHLSQENIRKEKLDGEIRVLTEQIHSAKENETHFRERMDALQARMGEYEEEKAGFDRKWEEYKELEENAAKILKAADESYQAAKEETIQMSDHIEALKQEIIHLLNEETNVKTKMQRYDTMLEQVHIRKAEINQKMLKFKSDNQEQEAMILNLQQEYEKICNEIAQSRDEIQRLKQEIGQLEAELSEDKKKQSLELAKYHKTNSNLETLKNLTERYEGYGNSIRRVMELKEQKKGIIGVVADIIKTEKKYEIAIETALGGNIQNIVTDTESTAKQAIEHLKKNKYGRATFLPLSSIANKTGFQNEQVFSEQGVIGLACDLIKIQREYENIGKYLLGRVVVVDTIEHALALARKYRYTLRIVTLEGELLNAGGSLSGGAYKNSSNLLGRRREIEELEKELAQTKAFGVELTERIAEAESGIASKREELARLETILREQSLVQNTVRMNLSKADEKKQELNDSYRSFKEETGDISRQMEEIKNNHDTLHAELSHWEEKNVQIEEEIKTCTAQLEQKKEEETKKQGEKEALRLKLSGMEQQLGFVEENRNRILAECTKIEKEKQELLESRQLASEHKEKRRQEIEQIKESIARTEEMVECLREEIRTIEEKKEKQAGEHKEFFSQREELIGHTAELDKELYRLESQREKQEERKEKLVSYMWEEYEMTYGAAKEYEIRQSKELSVLKREVQQLKQQIRALGSVNVNAIEEYKEVSERYEFLKNQHTDLTVAAENLEQIILELDTGMRKQFHEKFADIRKEFDKVFKILFGGGKGTIELGDSEDVLEAEITIISQPPGKKLQNMMQLSGGEKALTAIALLFAIQNLKPSPFCLLDEIEAALDDSNVDRYAQYLHKLTDHTQFIVITHRRGTMNAADRLYGITMQEKGISTLVSVNLIEDELEKNEMTNKE